MDAERATKDRADGDDLQARVAAVMARIAGGERSAVWDLHPLAEPSLSRMLRAEARRLDVWIGADDLLDLTLDAVVELGKLAGSWNPGGALPWVWATRRMVAQVHGFIGTFADELDESHLDLEAVAVAEPMPEPREALRSLARRHPAARRLDERLSATVSDRDADIWIGVQLEKAAGNRSPAVTIAVEHDMRPDAVRKVAQRVTERLSPVA